MIDLSALPQHFKQISLLGLGVSGLAAVKALQYNQVPFTVWDDNPDTRDKAAKDGLTLLQPVDTFGEADLVVQSAGMKPDHPILSALREKHVTLWNDQDLLFFGAPKARYLGITGTNGKSTTTALIGHILKANGINVAIGGNIGEAAPTLPMLDDTGVYVIEMSSYQLHSMKLLRCDVAVCLNITEDHVDWHGSMESYTSAKGLIFRPRDQHIQHAIIGLDTLPSRNLFETLKKSQYHRVTGITQYATQPTDREFTLIDGMLYDQQTCIGELTIHPVLKGVHNNENRMIAYAACRAIGLSSAHILQAMQSFGGLQHRQQPVGRYGDITFVNDSKATNADATAKALAVFDDIYWIVGGKDKSDGIDGLESFYPRIKKAYLIGDATERFAAKLDGQVPYERCGTIETALKTAFADARNGKATILLSPACASFDHYANFEKRGEDFITKVNDLLAQQPKQVNA